MGWKKLSAFNEGEYFYRGSLFRFRSGPPIDEIVDYLLFDVFEESGLGLVRDSGYGAGNVLVILPLEAKVPDRGAISPSWLIQNWQKWVHQNSAPDEVWVRRGGRKDPDKLPDE